MSSRLCAVLFDLDGTLADSAPDLLDSLNHVLAAVCRPPMAGNAVRGMIGDGALKMLEKGFVSTGEPLSDDDREPMLRLFLDYYEAHCADRSRLYPGCAEMLTALKQRGLKLAICTNKLQYLADRVADGLGLNAWIDSVTGAEEGGPRKPDPAMLKIALERLGCDPAQAVMVGDSSKDTEAARALGIPAIAVTYGYGPIPPGGLRADAVIGRLADLPDALDALPEDAWPIAPASA